MARSDDLYKRLSEFLSETKAAVITSKIMETKQYAKWKSPVERGYHSEELLTLPKNVTVSKDETYDKRRNAGWRW